MPVKLKKMKGGTVMYCPRCKKDTICSAIAVSEIAADSSNEQRIRHTTHQDLQWFRRARECQVCGCQFLTAEISEHLVDELATKRSNQPKLSEENQLSSHGFIISCPQCATKVRLPETLDDRTPHCPKCKFDLIVRIEAVSKDPHDVLGVQRGCDFAEIRYKFRKLISLYHPDRINQYGPELQNLANEISTRINNAYAELEETTKN